MQELDKPEEPTAKGGGGTELPGRLLGNEPGTSGDQDVVMTQGTDAPSEAPETRPPASPLRKRVDSSHQVQPVSPQGSQLLDGIRYYASLHTNSQRPVAPTQDSIGHELHQVSSQPQVPEPPEPVTPGVPCIPPHPSFASLIEYSSRTLVVLDNIDANATKTAELQNHVLLKKRNGKIQSK